MNSLLSLFPRTFVCSLLLLAALAHAGEPSLTWRAPETVTPGAKYSVSVSCVDAATVVLLKDGVVVASGQVMATAKVVERSGQPVVFTATAYGGSLKAEVVESRTVSVGDKNMPDVPANSANDRPSLTPLQDSAVSTEN